MLKKLFARNRSSSAAVPAASGEAMGEGLPCIPQRVRGEEISPFSCVIPSSTDTLDCLPPDLAQLWESIRSTDAPTKQRDRVRLFTTVQVHFPAKFVVPEAMVQEFLFTLRDFLSTVCANPMQEIAETAAASTGLFAFLQHCVLHDQSRMLLSQDVLRLLLDSYTQLIAFLPTAQDEENVGDFLQLFHSASLGLAAVGALLCTHEGDGVYLPEARGRVANLIKEAVMTVNSFEKLLALALTQFHFLSRNSRLSLAFHQSEFPCMDLSLSLLLNLYVLAKSHPLLPEICTEVLPVQLLTLHQTLLKWDGLDPDQTEFIALVDKQVTVIRFFVALVLQYKASGMKLLTDSKDLLQDVFMRICRGFARQTKAPLTEALQRERLCQLFELLQSVFTTLAGTPLETLPIEFFEWLHEEHASEELEAVRSHVLELLEEYVQSVPRTSTLAAESGLLSLILAPTMILGKSEQSDCRIREILKFALISPESKAVFVQEFHKGCLLYSLGSAYISALAQLLEDLVLRARQDWVPVLSQTHLVDCLFQLLMDSKQSTESHSVLKPLQVTVVTLLALPQLAESFLQEAKTVSKRLNELMRAADFEEFSLDLWARLLASNTSVAVYIHFARIIAEQNQEKYIVLLLRAIEKSLMGEIEERKMSQNHYLISGVLRTIVRSFDTFRSFQFWIVALPTLRALVEKHSAAQNEFANIGTKSLKSSILSIFDTCQRVSAYRQEIRILSENLLSILFDGVEVNSESVVVFPLLADVLIQVLICCCDEGLQSQYIDLLASCVSVNSVNALRLSVSGALRQILRFFTITHSKQIKQRLVEMVTALAKEHFGPADLISLVGLINDDTKASFPSDITRDLLGVVNTALEMQEREGCDSAFRFLLGGRIDCSFPFPKKHGLTIVLWAKLRSNSHLFACYNTDRTKTLVVATVNGSIVVDYVLKGASVCSCSAPFTHFHQFTMITVTYQPRTPMMKHSEICLYLHAIKVASASMERKQMIEDDSFQWFTIGGETRQHAFTGVLASAQLYLKCLTVEDVRELNTLGYRFTGQEGVGNYCGEGLPGNQVRDVMGDMAVFIHPWFVADGDRAVNAVAKLHSFRGTESFRNGAVASLPHSDSLLFPKLQNVLAERRTSVYESICSVGPRVFFPLLQRLEKTAHIKSALRQILEIIVTICRRPSSTQGVRGELLIDTLRAILEKLAKKIIFKTSTALLVLELKQGFSWSTEHQMQVVEALILNPAIWGRSKRTVQILMMSVTHEHEYIMPQDKVRLVSKIIRFCVVAFNAAGEETSDSCEFVKRAGELLKTYIDDGSTAAVIEEILENVVDYEDTHVLIANMLLRLLSFFAKRGKMKATDKFVQVLLYMLSRDVDGKRGYTLRILRLLKLTLMEDSKANDTKAIDSVFAYVSQQLKMKLSPAEYQSVLCLILKQPKVSPNSFPSLPLKHGYKALASDYKVVDIRFPQAIEILTSRLEFCATGEILSDLQMLAEQHISEVYTRETFPEWLIALCKRQETWKQEEALITLQSFVAVIFGNAIVKIDQAVTKFRKFLICLLDCEEQRHLVPSFLKYVLDFLLSTQEVNLRINTLRSNLPPLAYLLEDTVNLFKAESIAYDPVLAIRFVEVAAAYGMLTHSDPPLPMKSMLEAMDQYKFEDHRDRWESRLGGIERVALKVIFQSFRTANAATLGRLFSVLKFFVEPIESQETIQIIPLEQAITDFARTTTIISRPLGADVFKQKDFVMTLIFAELCDLMIYRHLDSTAVQIIAEQITTFCGYCDVLSPIEQMALSFTMDEHFDVKRFMEQYGVLPLAAAPLSADSLLQGVTRSHTDTWWQHDTFEVAKMKLLDKVTLVLKPALAKGAVDRVILSQDWVDSVHPLLVISTSSIVGTAESLSDLKNAGAVRKSSEFHGAVNLAADIKCRIDGIKAHRTKQKLDGDFLYAKQKWREYVKWQSREAGLWIKEPLSDTVWKLDPEFDLEFKCVRVKAMLGRCQSYYDDKAHKKAAETGEERIRRRLSPQHCGLPSTRRKHCMTVAIQRDEMPDFAELILAKSPSTAPPESHNKTFSGSWTVKSQIVDQYECERVQPKGSTLGFLEVTPKYLIFISSLKKKTDCDKYICSASVILIQKWNEISIKKKLVLRMADITDIFQRRFNQRYCAFEVFTQQGRSYLFNLFAEEDLRNFEIVAQQGGEFAGKFHTNLNRSFLAEKYFGDWRDGKISNFEYLMALNRFASRSFNDLNQYPVFPWVLSDYNSPELNLADDTAYRDLTKPIGALLPESRAEVERTYKQFEGDTEMQPHHFGSHYSTCGAVVYFLIRLEPFTSQAILLQDGQFDVADRVFASLPAAYSSSTRNSGDNKELVPEMFYLAEVLRNANRLPLGRGQTDRVVDCVELPLWAANDPHRFVRLHRAALESAKVSETLCHWVDLIFGYQQTGEAARQACNVFLDSTYESHATKLIAKARKDPAYLGYIDQILLYGQTPIQLFNKPHPRKAPERETIGTIFSSLMDKQFRRACNSLLHLSDFPLTPVALFLYHFFVVLVTSDRKVCVSKPKANSERFRDTDFKYLEGCLPDPLTPLTRCCVVMVSGGFLATGLYADYSYKLHAVEKMKLVASVAFHIDRVSCLYSENDHLLVGSRDTTLSLWTVASDGGVALLHHLRGHQAEVSLCALKWVLQVTVSAGAVTEVTEHLHSLKFSQTSDSLLLASEKCICLLSVFGEFPIETFLAKQSKAPKLKISLVCLCPTETSALLLLTDSHFASRTVHIDQFNSESHLSEVIGKYGF